MAIRAVLFDWGGTLVRDDSITTGRPAQAVGEYLRGRLKLDVTDEDFERAFQAIMPEYRPGETLDCPTISSLLGAAFTWLGIRLSAAEVEVCCERFFQATAASQQVFDDARAILSSLRYRGYRIGVVTNTIFPSDMMRGQLRQLGLAGYLDTVVTSADIGLSKPHPAAFQRALGDLGLEAHDAIFVGDRVDTDIVGARAAGMRALLLERTDRARDRAGFLVIERLSALNDLLGEGAVT